MAANSDLRAAQSAGMNRPGIGAKHRTKRILAVAEETEITVIEPTTGEILSTTPSSPTVPTGETIAHVGTHGSPVSRLIT